MAVHDPEVAAAIGVQSDAAGCAVVGIQIPRPQFHTCRRVHEHGGAAKAIVVIVVAGIVAAAMIVIVPFLIRPAMIICYPDRGTVADQAGRVAVGRIQSETLAGRLRIRQAAGRIGIAIDPVRRIIHDPDVGAVGRDVLWLIEALGVPGATQGAIGCVNKYGLAGVYDP